jgi:hypothetical protein
MSVPVSMGRGAKYLVKTNNAFLSSTDQLESLILAQNERWRQA